MKKGFFNYAARIALIYWLVSFIWIYTSDTILEFFIQDPDNLTKIQTIKGLGFITFTALLIFYLVRYYQKKQKSIENKIIENEERQRLLIENSMDAIMITAPDGSILDVNPACERIFGRSAEEIKRLGRNGIVDTSDPRLEAALKFRQEHGYFIGELTYVRKDGTIFPGDVSSQFFKDSEGNVRSSMIIRDVSERRKLEQDYASINLQYKRTLESISDALITIDRNWIITSVNARAAEINKKPPQEFVGKIFWEEWPALIDTPVEKLSRKTMLEGVTTHTENHYYIEGVYDVWLDVNIYPSEDGLTMIYRDISDKKHLEKSLQESEERLRLAISSAQQGIYDLNLLTGEVIVNDTYASMLGYDPNHFQETLESWKERIHPDDRLFTTNYLNDFINGLVEDYHLEFRLKTKTGNWIWILSVGSIVNRDDTGKPLRMLGTHTDITARKIAEQDKALYNHIVEETLNEIYIFKVDTYQFVQANKAAMDNLGYSMNELRKMTPIDIKPEYTIEKFNEVVTPLLNGSKKGIKFETTHLRKNGSTYDVEVHLQLLKLEHESLFTAIILDISDRKRNEKILSTERKRLASIIKGTNVGTWEWNVQTGETLFNERWAEIVGYTIQELEPISIETWKNLTHPDDLNKAQAQLQEHFSGKKDYYDIEFRMKHKDGHWVWIQDRGRVSEWTEDGKPLVMQGTHYDISHRKLNESKILEQLDELQHWHQITLGREERIIELKEEVNQVLLESGRPVRYESVRNIK